PVYSVQRNPAFPKNFFTVGDCTVKLWTEDFYSSPILSTPPSNAKLSCAAWSPSRCSVLLAGRMDGVLDIWDLLCRWDKPQHSLQVMDCSVESVDTHDSGELVAVGSQQGALALLRLPPHLARPFVKQDKAEFSSILERETRRERVLEGRLKESRMRKRVRVPPP
ncbi:WD40-repeat-containing domain, partial [Trinorchestia longiramus]